MTKKLCDRCKKECSTRFPWQNSKLPKYRIIKTYDFPIGTLDVDLCDSCLEDFENWLNYKEDDK